VRIVETLRTGALWNFFHMGAIANPPDEPSDEVLRLDFNRRLMVQFRGSMAVCSPHRKSD
jgi:hypothetical protein